MLYCLSDADDGSHEMIDVQRRDTEKTPSKYSETMWSIYDTCLSKHYVI